MAQEHYAEKEDVEAIIGIFLINDARKTRPSATALERLLIMADGQINGELGPSVIANITDTTGYLRTIESQLILRMVNNIYAFSNPNDYTLVPLEFTTEEKILIHKAASGWAGLKFELGE